MPITVERIPDEPIIVANCTGFITKEDFVGMFVAVDKLTQTMEGTIYRIADYREANSSFVDILKTVQEASKGMPGSTTDPRIQTVWVGTTQWIALARNFFQQQQFGGLNVPAFHDMDTAFDYVKMERAKQAQAASETSNAAD